ncbi:High mobility group protein B1 [Chelonia mydas]|uniref:High mobility group protein B1 n=1 Tax=Chelonia mydas TaxID=8469 RepID=M7BGD0_CHEMY|nr:High mobility group protein B1 [Chelonia mydas]
MLLLLVLRVDLVTLPTNQAVWPLGSLLHASCIPYVARRLVLLQTIPDNTNDMRKSAKMGKGDPKKPRGKMSSYAFFVQTCREEHKKKHPDASVNFSEFSKKCSERWKTMSVKEKGKFEDMAKADKVRYEREMKNYIPPKGETKKKFKDPNAPKRPPSAFFLFCAEFRPKIKGEHPGLSIGDVAKKLGEMWNNTAADDKQPYEKKAAKLKEKYEKVNNGIQREQKVLPCSNSNLND